MAEVFGVVASALAVAELTGKFGVSVVKLKKLWDEIQDVPEEMNRLMRRLEILKPVLAEMEAEFTQQRHKVYHNSAANLSLEYCRQAVDDLEALTDDLQMNISAAKRSRRNITKLKVSFKKEIIRGYQERIDFALQLMSLSQQTYIIAIVKLPPSEKPVQSKDLGLDDRLCQISQQIQSEDSPLLKSSVYQRQQQENPKPLPWKEPSFLGALRYEKSCHSVYPRSPVRQARLQLPQWLSEKVWDFQLYRTCRGWQISLTPWFTRHSFGRVILDALHDDDVSGLQRALDSGEASIFDRVPSGRTLLHVRQVTQFAIQNTSACIDMQAKLAAGHGRLEVSKALITSGLSSAETDIFGESAAGLLLGFVSPFDGPVNETVVLELVNLFMDSGLLDEDIEALFRDPGDGDPIHLYTNIWRIPGFLQSVVGHRLEEYTRLPVRTRFYFFNWYQTTPAVFLAQLSLGQGVSPAEFRAVDGFYDENPTYSEGKSLQCLARTYFRRTPERWRGMSPRISNREYYLQQWRQVTRWVLTGITLDELTYVRQVGRDLLTPLAAGLLGFKPSAMYLYSEHYESRQLQDFSRALHFWLEDVQSVGIDLMEYGRREFAAYFAPSCSLPFQRGSVFGLLRVRPGDWGPRLASFTFGPQVEDWELIWELDVEELTGIFWHLVENPPLHVPGGWVEDDCLDGKSI